MAWLPSWLEKHRLLKNRPVICSTVSSLTLLRRQQTEVSAWYRVIFKHARMLKLKSFLIWSKFVCWRHFDSSIDTNEALYVNIYTSSMASRCINKAVKRNYLDVTEVMISEYFSKDP